MRRRAWGLLVVAGVLVIGRPAPGFAENCAAITAKLARLGQAAAATDFSGAAARQRDELASARAQKARCDISGSGQCASLAALVASMETNLARLDAKARQAAPPDSKAARRASLQQRFAASCAAKAAAQDENKPSLPALGLLAWFGQGAATTLALPPPPAGAPLPPVSKAGPTKRLEKPAEHAAFTPSGQFGKGNYRTLCVRSCDGYFWPVSYQTSKHHFAQDDATCHASCPQSEVALYVHRNPGESIEEAVDLGGKPYSELKTAYSFRKKYDSACSCRAPPAPVYGDAKDEGTGVQSAAGGKAGIALPPDEARVRPISAADETPVLRGAVEPDIDH